MLMKQLIEVHDLLDSSYANGKGAMEYLKTISRMLTWKYIPWRDKREKPI